MFKVVPGNFFVPLSSPNRLVYWECICKLFSVMENQLSFGVERELLVDELQYYFEQNNAADFVEEEFSTSDSRGKANGILRRLEAYGWIEIETDKSYVQRVNFKEYAVKMLKVFLEFAEGKQLEYQGYIYTIYSLVRTSTKNPGIMLTQVVENTDMLITGLKNLNSNIKHYIDDLTRHSTVAEIMDALFNDYITNIVDKAYHRLLTSDNVSKFRPEIIERLESMSRSKSFVEKAAEELGNVRELDAESARELTFHYLHMVIEAFRNIDDILEEINHKNTQYQKAAINRAKFLLTGNEDIRGQMKEILLHLNTVINENRLDMGGIYEIEFLDGLVRLYSSGILDENSFYSPIEGRKEFVPSQLTIAEPDIQQRQEKLQKMMEKMQRILSPSKIEQYVAAQLGERQMLRAAELPLQETEDFIKVIYIRLYGQRKNMKYRIETKEKITKDGFSFTDFEIWRK